MSIFVKYFLVFIVSMVPLFELRYTMVTLVPALGVNYVIALIIGIIGNMVPVPIIYLFARKVLEWGKDKKVIGNFFTWCLNKGERGGKKLEEKAGKGLYWALFLFVGIPLPGTGAWTGTLAASMLKLDFKKTVFAVMAGVVFAGLIMMAISFGLFEVIF
ncbi:MAG: small multidrug export protein [Firmicutes bacterium]|nr:small multidrug export protein [Bacillota bacterium]